jgi:hypothetical protein
MSKKILLEKKECFAMMNRLDELIEMKSRFRDKCVSFIKVFKNIQIEKIAGILVDKSI